MRLPAIFLLLLVYAAAEAQMTQERPNILFIMVDDLNDYVGYLQGHPQALTPNMDRLANKGTSFTNAFCNAPVCAPSRASMLTGKDPLYTQIYHGNDYYQPVFRSNFSATDGNGVVYTIPEWLKDSAGYYTMSLGKIFHGRNPNPVNDMDYDATGDDNCSREKSWSDIKSLSGGPPEEPAEEDFYGNEVISWGILDNADESEIQDYRAVDSALQFLTAYKNDPAQAACDRPFFLGVGIFKPHQPFFAPERYWPDYYAPDLFEMPYQPSFNYPAASWPPNGIEMPPQPENRWEDFDSLGAVAKVAATEPGYWLEDQMFSPWADSLGVLPEIRMGLTDEERYLITAEAARANAVTGYLASVRFSDAQIGRLLDKIESDPVLANNTVIVLASDHGFSLGQKKLWKKQALWEDIIRIPMIIVDPRQGASQVCERPVSLLDLFPTMCAIAGVEEPSFPDGSRYADGEDLTPLLENPNAYRNKPVLTSLGLPYGSTDGGCFEHFSVRDERFHYILYRTNNDIDSTLDCSASLSRWEEELYELGTDRKVDPNEWNNLADDPSYAGIKNHLAQWLPIGDLYGQSAGTVLIGHEELPCLLNPDSAYQFYPRVFNEQGEAQALSDYTFRWLSPALQDEYQQRIFELNPSNILEEVLEEEGELVLTLVAKHAETDQLLSTVIRLAYDTEEYPTLFFSTQFESPGIVKIVGCTQTDDDVFVNWDFGDGHVVEGDCPDSHQYTSPGPFTITATALYGHRPDRCEVSFLQTFTIPEAFFTDTCLTPVPPIVDQTASNGVEVSVSAVFGASNYNFRWREELQATSAWMQESALMPSRVIDQLKPNSTWRVEAQAICADGMESGWSWPAYAGTDPCAPPNGLSAVQIPLGAELKWKRGGYTQWAGQLAIAKAGLTDTVYINVSNQNTLSFDDLEPETAYRFRLRTNCSSIESSESPVSFWSPEFEFSTGGVPATTADSEISVVPNPNDGQFQLIYLGDQEGPVKVRLYDMYGRQLRDEKWVLMPNQADIVPMTLSNPIPGLYHFEVTFSDRSIDHVSFVVR